MGVKPPAIPEYDYYAQRVLDTFYLTLRERSYIDGQPLPISVSNITSVVSIHPVEIHRAVLDHIIFELDHVALNEHKSKSKHTEH